MKRIYYAPRTGQEECPNCRTVHTLHLERDDDGYYIEIDTVPCSDDHCTKKLCSACPQFACPGCRLDFCLEHAVTVDGVPYCDQCAPVEEAGAVVEVEASQQDAALVFAAAQAGCSPAEARALLLGVKEAHRA